MAMFVHLAPESVSAKLRRNGIKCARCSFGECSAGVFAVPVVRDFSVSHQWLRELKRKGARTLVGIYFRVPDDQAVFVGHYNQSHQEMTAAESVGEFDDADDPQGWEVVIPRRIEPKEIHAVRAVPQVVGWRFYPDAKGSKPFCACKFCTRGEYGSRRLRERLGDDED